jgi:hypothetical protein
MSQKLADHLSSIRETAIANQGDGEAAWLIELKIARTHTGRKREQLLCSWVTTMSEAIARGNING